jgi:hypothetical protein
MNKKINMSVIFTLIIFTSAWGGDDYKMPPKAIADLVDAPGTPGVSVSPNKKHILILERSAVPPAVIPAGIILLWMGGWIFPV